MTLATGVKALAEAVAVDVKALEDGKVDKEPGKGLSESDYTTEERTKLAGIEVGATKNRADSANADKVHTHTTAQITGLDTALESKASKTELSDGLALKVDKVAGKELSDTNFTQAEKTKLSGIATGATKNSTDAQLRARASHTGVQAISTVTGLQAGLDSKVDKVDGKGLSDTNFTQAEKDKLSSLESSKFVGLFVNEGALPSAGSAGDYANVDGGVGSDVYRVIWDSSDSKWVRVQGLSTELTDAQIKQQYESNPDTNAFTDEEKTKLSGIATGATKNRLDSENADSFHIHTLAEVTNLETALADKASATDLRFTDSREWTAATISQAEAEDGVASTRRAFTAQRVRQAINAWWQLVTSGFGRNFIAASNEQAARNVLQLGAAATKDVGTAAGQVMEVGAFGLGRRVSFPVGYGFHSISNAFKDGSPVESGFYYGANDGASFYPITLFAKGGVGTNNTGSWAIGKRGGPSDVLYFWERPSGIAGEESVNRHNIFHSGVMLNIGKTAASARSALGLGAHATRWPTFAEVTGKPIVQTTGASTTDIMSQKAVTDALAAAAPVATAPVVVAANATVTLTNGRAVYAVNTTSAARTLTLPANPPAGATVTIIDYANTCGINKLTIARNGRNIEGAAANAALTQNGQRVEMVYIDAAQGWKVVSSYRHGGFI